MQKKLPQIPAWRQNLYVLICWCLILISLYICFFISRIALFVPAIVAQAIYTYKIKKCRRYIVPNLFVNWLYSTCFYKRIFRRAKADKAWRSGRNLAFLLLGLGVILHMVRTSNGPVVDLDEMSVVIGKIDSYQKTDRRNFCGDFILELKKEDGSSEKYFENSSASLEGRQKSIGREVILWAQPFSFFATPKCKRHLFVWQIVDGGFEKRYQKGEREQIAHDMSLVSNFFLIIGLILFACLILYPPDNHRNS